MFRHSYVVMFSYPNMIIKENYFETDNKYYIWYLVYYFKQWNNKKLIKIE